MFTGRRIKPLGLHRVSCRAITGTRADGSKIGFRRYDGPIVISGISGRFPNASNTSELTKKLLAGVELTSETTKRWDDLTLPKRFGFLQNLDRFDAEFFMIPQRQAQEMDPQTRLLLEVAFEAIIDAGINPVDFRGSRTGVFCGAYGQESYDCTTARVNRDERGWFVASKTNYMIPGRIAFHLDLRGPSTILCTACSSSFTALETAILSIEGGKCEAALVTGSNVHLNNLAQKNIQVMDALAPDGRCKAFDESADGFARSEAAVGILVQKEHHARRNYLRIRSIRSNTDGFKSAGVTHPDRRSIATVMKETYEACGIDPSQVSYVEAHGTGTPAGDPEEFHAIHKVFCQGPTVRKKPLLVGSVKTNLGHTECAAGLSGVAKVIGAVQTGTLPGNLFFHKPNPEIKPLLDGTVEIVTQPTPFDGGIVGICSSGIGGTNYHVVLEPGPITDSKHEHQLPVIVPISGRSEAQVENSIVQALENASNPEYVNLLQAAFQRNIPGHPYKGYGLYFPNDADTKAAASTISVERCDEVERPVWAVFPGMGAQWNGMGKDLMRIEPFANSVSQSRETLGQLGVDLDQLLAEDNCSIFTNIHHAFLSITAMQIALWDTVCALEIKAEGFVGHSAGEGLCAYADGCLSAEETLVVADARGRAMRDHQKVVGGMVAVGTSANQVRPRLPPGVQIACENTPDNITLSGELELVTEFGKRLKAEGILIASVDSCGVAAHGQHVEEAADILTAELKGVIKDERMRGSRWISTSVPEAEWDSDAGRFASAEYFGNNVAKPVLFRQALEKIPAGSVVIEISPKGFFQTILNGALPADCVHVAPMTVKAKDKMLHFFNSMGKMYTSGVSLKMENLYPPVSLPVPSNTPSISPLVQWDHAVSWKTGVLPLPADLIYESAVSLEHPEYAYLAGHKVDNRILMPATGYLHSIWMQFAENFGRHYQDFPVRFRDVAFKRPTILSHDVATNITYFLQSTAGVFHIESGGDLVVTGRIERLLEEQDQTEGLLKPDLSSSTAPIMSKEDFYMELRLRGLNFSGAFQCVQAADSEGKWADIAWNGNWTCLLDAILQSTALESTLRNLVVPVDIECITIDPCHFMRHLQHANDKLVRATSLPNQKIVRVPGITIKALNTGIIPQTREIGNLAYESYSFSPFFQGTDRKSEATLSELIDLVLDNAPSAQLKVFDVFQNADNSLALQFQKVLSSKPSYESNVSLITLASEATKIAAKFKTESTPNIIVKCTPEELAPEVPSDLVFLDEPELLSSTSRSLKEGGFVLVQSGSSLHPVEIEGLRAVSQKKIGNKLLSLFRKVKDEAKKILQVSVDKEEFQWVPELQDAVANAKDDTCRIYLTSQGNAVSGILGLTNCLRREENGSRIRCILDPEGELDLDFTKPDARLRSIISLDLAANVLYEGQLGSYRHVLMSDAKPDTDAVATKDAYVGTLTPGDLSSLRWLELPTDKFTPGLLAKNCSDDNTYTVSYAALNFRDVLLASRTIPLEHNYSYKGLYMGQEFSGFDENGTRVMGTADGTGMATKIFSKPNFITQVPDHWTLEEAATVPIVYYTVLYALHMRAHIQAGQTVLVHAGSGGVGQAAISVALAHGCRVFTTVGTPEKREFIKRRFPQILDDHIGNSRDTSFEAQFMEVTNGHGVDVVLNSLAGEKLKASVRCLALHGKFLEIGVADAYMNTQIGMRPFLKNIDFSAVELQTIMRNPGNCESTLQKLLKDGIKNGSVTPLPTHVFEHDQVEEAFRFMAKGKHMGKILIKIRESLSDPLRIQASRRTYFLKDKTYLIAGGLGGLGLEVANWMVERGARKLILTSRSGLTNGYQAYCLEKWRKAGAAIEILTVDLSDKRAAEEFMLNAAFNGVNLGGIINSAVALRDAAFANQTADSFQEVSSPKAEMTAALDELSRKYCTPLDLFVVFSSYSCGRGNPGQANYGWANSVMERICEKRKADGLHGLAIQWGPIGQVGIAQRLFTGKGDMNLFGTTFQSIASCLEILDNAILQTHSAVVSSGTIADKKESKGERGGLMQRLQKMFGIADIQAVDPQRNLNELGMDSIVAGELKQTLEREYEVSIKNEHLAMLTIGDLKSIGDGTFDVSTLGNARVPIQEEETYEMFKLHDEILVQLKVHKTKRQVFILHGGEGSTKNLRPLAAKLLANVHAFQMAKDLQWTSISHLASHYVNELKEKQPTGPYTILGYSGGCAIAFEMAQQLKSAGEVIEHLVFLDGSPSYGHIETSKPFVFELLRSMSLLDKISQHSSKTLEANLAVDDKAVIAKTFELVSTEINLGPAQAEAYKKLITHLGKHVPQGTYDGQVHVLKAADSAYDASPNNDGIRMFCTGRVTDYSVQGNHRTFLTVSYVDESANIINSLLTKSSG